MNDTEQKNMEFMKTYDDFSDNIFRHIYFRVYNRERAMELMQDTFMKTWNYISKGGKIINLKAFLYKTANNLVIDEFRKKKEESLEALEEQGINPKIENKEEIETKIESDKVKRVLSQLEDKYGRVITMKYIDELSIKEIAEVTGETENNVSVRLNRGLKQLRQILNYG